MRPQRRAEPDGRSTARASLGRPDRRALGRKRAPANEVDTVVVAAMAELGLDLRAARPKSLTEAAVRASDVVVTMGCGDACPIFPGKRYEDWQLDDPAGRDLDAVRRIRDEIDARVSVLVSELLPAASGARPKT